MGEEVSEKYGYFIRILLGPKIVIVISDPKNTESFLVDGKTTEKSEEYEYANDWIGEGLITSNIYWTEMVFTAKNYYTCFSFRCIAIVVNTFDCNGTIFVEKLKNRESIDIFLFFR